MRHCMSNSTNAKLPEIAVLQPAMTEAFPELAGLPFNVLNHSWDSVAIDVDDSFIFKFPRSTKAKVALQRESRFLAHIRPRVWLAVPDMSIHSGPPLFSRHRKIKGEHLENFAALSDRARSETASKLGQFYAQLHQLDAITMVSFGAQPLPDWGPAANVLTRAITLLPPTLHEFANRTVHDWANLPPDPHGLTYGFFDGHGWNMAFDHETQSLNGIYDFADSGIAPIHQEFVYSSLTSAALTAGILKAYEKETGRKLDRHRLWILTAMHRLWELADPTDGEEHIPAKILRVAAWAATDVSVLTP